MGGKETKGRRSERKERGRLEKREENERLLLQVLFLFFIPPCCFLCLLFILFPLLSCILLALLLLFGFAFLLVSLHTRTHALSSALLFPSSNFLILLSSFSFLLFSCFVCSLYLFLFFSLFFFLCNVAHPHWPSLFIRPQIGYVCSLPW